MPIKSFWKREDYSDFIFGTVCAVCFLFIVAMAMIFKHFNIFVIVYLIICLSGMFAPSQISKFIMKALNLAHDKVGKK